MMREGETGEAAFKTWMDARRPEVDRVLMAINEITLSSGVTVSQLTVAASMLGDLARLALADETREREMFLDEARRDLTGVRKAVSVENLPANKESPPKDAIRQ